MRALTWRVPHPNVDPAMAQAGAELFTHTWKPGDKLAASGDGLGPVFNANSCLACHHLGGEGGAGGLQSNVTVFTVRPSSGVGEPREGVVHSHATKPEFRETRAQVEASLPTAAVRNDPHCAVMNSRPIHFSERNTPALFGAKLIDEISDREIIAQERRESLRLGMASSGDEVLPVGRALRLANGRVGKFGWKAQTASLSDFVQAACANELGLSNPGHAQPRSLAKPSYEASGLDLTQEQCNQLTAFVASLDRPTERLPEQSALREKCERGKQMFMTIGCADCHTPSLGSVHGLYSDLLLHRMGAELQGGGSYNEPAVPLPDFSPDGGPQPGEWRTPPLWGVADSAPYLHDGRARTLDDAIRQHGGQGSRARDCYIRQGEAERGELLAFLQTLRAPDAK
jgi:CxxC motif-containing protein (DUF1111 family)